MIQDEARLLRLAGAIAQQLIARDVESTVNVAQTENVPRGWLLYHTSSASAVDADSGHKKAAESWIHGEDGDIYRARYEQSDITSSETTERLRDISGVEMQTVEDALTGLALTNHIDTDSLEDTIASLRETADE